MRAGRRGDLIKASLLAQDGDLVPDVKVGLYLVHPLRQNAAAGADADVRPGDGALLAVGPDVVLGY